MSTTNRIQPQDFRYTLKIRGTDYVLAFSPGGWDESLITWKRSDLYFGMARTFTVSLDFVKDGADLLRAEFYQFGIEAKVDLLIEELNSDTWQYETLLLGALDFSRFKDSDHIVTITVMEGGITQQIKAYENIAYEIDIDVPEAIEVEFPGLPLQQTFTDVQIPFTGSLGFNAYIPGLSNILHDLTTSSIEIQEVENQHFSGIGASPDYTSSSKWFLKNISASAITINLYFEIKGAFNGLNLIVGIYNNSNVKIGDIFNGLTGIKSEIVNTVSFSVAPGERIFYDVRYGTGSVAIFKIDEGLIKCSFGSAFAATTCKVLRPKYVFDKLMEKMNGSPIETQSFLLEEWEQLTITSGDAIRGIVGAKLKTSFRDFFQSINSTLNIGFSVENGKPTLEAKSYYYKSNLPAANVGTIKNFSLEPADEYMYNSVKIGYQNQNYDELNGRDEFNATQVYSLPVTRIQKELNLVSPYRADCFGIEYTRINLSGKDSTDSKGDNDTFFIYIKPDLEPARTVYRPERSESYTSVTGVLSPTNVFNLKLSPKQCLKRHGDYLRSILHRLEAKQVTFESADKNTDLVTVDLNGVRTAEKDSITVTKLRESIFLPYMASITAAFPKNILSLLDKFPTGFIKFTYKGSDFQLFILEASVDVAKNKEQEFRGLLAPNNDLFKFLRKK